MRSELDRLVAGTLSGDNESAGVLHDVLEGCLDLESRSHDEWEDHASQRTWPEVSVERVAPELAYFLPTPAELEETLTRLRLGLLQGERLSVPVMNAIDRYADRAVFFVLVDVLGSYDGAQERYQEIEVALRLLATSSEDVSDKDQATARRAIEHVRDVGAGVVDGSFSLRHWANIILARLFEDRQAQYELELDEDDSAKLLRIKPGVKSEMERWLETWTIDILIAVAPLDRELAAHLRIWTRRPEGTGTARPLMLITGSGTEPGDDNAEELSPWHSLRSPLWGARISPDDLPELIENILHARWQEPGQVQLFIRNSSSEGFDLHTLEAGTLIRHVPRRT